MVFDFLPWKMPGNRRIKRLGIMRYFLFGLSLIFTVAIMLFWRESAERIMWFAFIAGNILYYIAGIMLSIIFKDNRAFCKYLCPVTVFLKPASYFSLIRIKVDESKCTNCGNCVKVCPVDVGLRDAKRSRKNGTECILCLECAKSCPKRAIGI
jgi:polyferredoxin